MCFLQSSIVIMFPHLGRAWANSITRECWRGFVRSCDANPIIGMCAVFTIGSIGVVTIVPPLREHFDLNTSQISKTSPHNWQALKDVHEAGLIKANLDEE